jgi:hypothetical protein
MSDERLEESDSATEPRLQFSRFSRQTWFLGLSIISLVLCGAGGILHYSKWAWGNPWQVVGWILSILFLLLAFSPQPKEVVTRIRASFNWKTLFFLFWILVFTASRLWNFRTAPWNGDGLFDESGWDLYFLKDFVIGHPYQAAWFHAPISRETLFHYYVWLFLRLFGYNILSYEAALFGIWCTTFVFTLLLVDLFFGSKLVTSLVALILNFLPFFYNYTFAGYRYPMATALCMVSLYFLHLGFRTRSGLSLALGGLTAGLCLASSISGKQYLFVLVLCGVIYAAFHWRKAKGHFKWAVPIIVYGFLVAATPLCCYIAFTFEHYTFYETSLVAESLRAGLGFRAKQLWECFFKIPGARFFIPDTLPIPLSYYWFLLPGFVLALWRRRYEIVLLALIPVLGAFLATSWENRLLLAVPFWVILMAFTFDTLERTKFYLVFKIALWGGAVFLVWSGLGPSLKYIDTKTKDPFSIRYFAQGEVAVSRFIRHVVSGTIPLNPPHLERNELKKVAGVPKPSFDTFVCQESAYSILHLFLHDYGDMKIMSFSGQIGFFLQSEQQMWLANKTALSGYVPIRKDLKLMWERHPKTDRIIRLFQQFRDIGREESISFSFAGQAKSFYTLTVPDRNIPQLQDRVRALPDTLP